jgi:hypothetical protein
MSFIENFEKLYNKSVDDICKSGYSIPDIQREIKNENIAKIIEFQKDYFDIHQSYCLNHSISIGIDIESGITYLLDGQHRMKAYLYLRKEFPERVMSITIDTYYCKGIDNINKTYKYINTHSPNDITVLGIDEYKILQTFEKLICKQFKNYFKSSTKPNRPNLSISPIKDYIVSENVLKKTGIKTGEQFYQIVLELNRYYSDISSFNSKLFGEWGIKDYAKVIEKINSFENKLYLGLYSNYEWIDRIVDHFTIGIEFKDMQHISKSWRPKITKNLKIAVWKAENGNTLTDGKCYCCEGEITYENFECGHIIPVSIGGKTNIENLKAICGQCNMDMKTMNLEDYKKLLQSQLNDV